MYEVSVDTHLKGKNLGPYRRVQSDDVTFLLSPKLVQWAGHVGIDYGRKFLRRTLIVDVEHRHGPHCSHG